MIILKHFPRCSDNMQTIEEIKTALFSANPDVPSGIKKCNQLIRQLTQMLNEAENIAKKQQITATLGQAKSYKEMFNALRITGEGYEPRRQMPSDRVKWVDLPSAFKGRIKTGVITNLKHTDPIKFLEDASSSFSSRILRQLKDVNPIKVNAVFCGEFIKMGADKILKDTKYFNTANEPLYMDTNRPQWYNTNIKDVILNALEEFQEKDSGWALSRIINLQINVNKFTPMLGSSYIELPPQIIHKKACVNVKNDDNRCFAWAVVSALHPVKKDPQRTTKYPDPSTVLNLTGIHFPMTAKQIPRFEKQNNLSINVYKLEGKKKNFITLPTYLTSNKQKKHINLLVVQDDYYNDDDEEDGPIPQYHYVWIKNLSRLLVTSLNKHKGKNYFCDRCLNYFYTEQKRDEHYKKCTNRNKCQLLPPLEKNRILKFKNFNNKVKAPFIIYADLECLLQPTTQKTAYQQHIPCSVGYYVKCSYDDSLSFYRAYRGKDCIEWFTKELYNFAEDVETVFLCDLPMEELSSEEKTAYNNANKCHICNTEFIADDKKVRDHCHLTGKYRGPAHNSCNINYQDSHIVPVVFHNLSGYDSHFIIKDLAANLPGKVDLLPVNMERYISFTKNFDENLIKFRFIDSLRFMASGLAELASNLQEYPELQSQFTELSNTEMDLLSQKGIYPYDYVDSWAKFEEECLPPKSAFYNRLNNADITDAEYIHAQTVWRRRKIQNLGEYSDLYLKTDVLLLADVFEQFRSSCLKTYELDPAHYYTLPGYTWDCMLKHTNIELELLTDVDMIMFVEDGIRGGLSQCMKRYAKANNKYMPEYDPNKPSTFLLYTDINNQYGWAMSQHLPYGGFKWATLNDAADFNVENIPDHGDVGYLLEVDLEYPQDVHDAHADLPFCPEHKCPPGVANKKENEKLMATLNDKQHYVIHYRALKLALENGLKLKKIHRVLEFKQSPWLKSYIDLNTQLRTAARNDFEKNLFKLMNNAVFGKTMENIRKRTNVKLVNKWEGRYGAEAYISKPEFKAATIFEENLVAIELSKTQIYFNKPIYIGQAILDISKIKLYEFHYGYMKTVFGKNCAALYTDTDSIIYEIAHNDVYEMIKRDCYVHFDTADYPPNNIYDIPLVNKKVLGMMKDEMNGKIMTEFAGLRSKMYSIRVEGKDVVKKAKGVKRHIVKNEISFQDYIDCLNTFSEKMVEQNLIHSKKHQVFTITQQKIALSPFDDKRFITKGSYTTLPWGHYSINDATAAAAVPAIEEPPCKKRKISILEQLLTA